MCLAVVGNGSASTEGSLGHMGPEQILAIIHEYLNAPLETTPLDLRAHDMWSAMVMILHVLLGKLPFVPSIDAAKNINPKFEGVKAEYGVLLLQKEWVSYICRMPRLLKFVRSHLWLVILLLSRYSFWDFGLVVVEWTVFHVWHFKALHQSPG